MTAWQLALQALNTHLHGAHKCENEKCNKRFDLPPDGGKNKRFCSEA